VLFFGLIRPYKGLEDLVRAFDMLDEEEVQRFHLTVVGETWENWTLPAELIANSRYRDRITFVNRYVDDSEVAACFRAADALVLPYRRASSSAVLQIAQSLGLPVVATRVDGLREAVEEYAGAVQVMPNDVEALCDALRKVAGMQGQRFANPRSWERIGARYHQLFSELMGPTNASARSGRGSGNASPLGARR
jgi:glycosyltransferase involved in cell wall biosynthesis